MSALKATSEEWTRYYAETARRGQHGRNDPIQRQRSRALVRERLWIVAGVVALAGTLAAYLVMLAR
jgi:hypothetical protein